MAKQTAKGKKGILSQAIDALSSRDEKEKLDQTKEELP